MPLEGACLWGLVGRGWGLNKGGLGGGCSGDVVLGGEGRPHVARIQINCDLYNEAAVCVFPWPRTTQSSLARTITKVLVTCWFRCPPPSQTTLLPHKTIWCLTTQLSAGPGSCVREAVCPCQHTVLGKARYVVTSRCIVTSSCQLL